MENEVWPIWHGNGVLAANLTPLLYWYFVFVFLLSGSGARIESTTRCRRGAVGADHQARIGIVGCASVSIADFIVFPLLIVSIFYFCLDAPISSDFLAQIAMYRPKPLTAEQIASINVRLDD
jgi:hypothetical protein